MEKSGTFLDTTANNNCCKLQRKSTKRQICKSQITSYQFRPQPGYCSIYLRPPQLLIGLVTPADANRSDSGSRVLRIFFGLSCRSEGVNQFVFNVLQNHGGQSVLTVTVPVHAVRVCGQAVTCCFPALLGIFFVSVSSFSY